MPPDSCLVDTSTSIGSTTLTMPDPESTLPAELELALAYTLPSARDAMRTFFAFDQRLARIVAATTEPVLGQMRLAWWRDMLGTPRANRPTGDVVLDAIGDQWEGHEELLGKLVDAWEVLVVAEKLGADDLAQFAAGRGHPFSRFVNPQREAERQRAAIASQRWALADIVTRITDPDEREAIVRVAQALCGPAGRHSRELRGLAVLDALAIRALKRSGEPLLEGRGSSLVALRAGLFGR